MDTLKPLPPRREPEGPKTPNWPLLINLFILLVAAGASGFNRLALAGVLVGLVALNGITGVVLLLAGHRIPYALAFVGSALLIALIGFGVCGWELPASA